uniref:uncharacterized protein LOC120331778 isoform X2 n=1 Tax=Styela clava TaxID=7725 RepID=UPI0019394F57|nr:uncharacterized protein LOC120331778 isoform X2 [Styela clava]
MYLKWILLFTALLIQNVISACPPSTTKMMTTVNGTIQSPNYPQKFWSSHCRKWQLPHHEFSQNSSLVLFVRTMNMMFVSKTTYLAGSLLVNGTNIATMSNGTCLIFHGSNQKCRNLENIKMQQKCSQRLHSYEAIDSFTVKFKPSPDLYYYGLRYPRKFQLDYEYLPCMEDTSHGTSTVHEKQDDSGAVGAAVAFGIICGLLSAILIAVAIRRFRKKAVIDGRVNNTMVTSPSNQYESTMQCDGKINPDTIYHTVDKPDETTEKETVVNQLYAMAS